MNSDARTEACAPRVPSWTELDRAGRKLVEVLELAEALPARHERELRYPRLITRQPPVEPDDGRGGDARRGRGSHRI